MRRCNSDGCNSYVALALGDDFLGGRRSGEVALSSGNGYLAISLIYLYRFGGACLRAFGLIFVLGRSSRASLLPES
jgi:hypothetical protein